jgi:Ca2+-binding RTX toxin-like protein
MADILGDASNNFLNGTDASDNIRGLAGSDTLRGLAGNDVVNGNQDNDIVNGNAGDDSVYGGQGNDSVYGGQGNDVVNGNDGDDVIVNGNIGNDTVYGGKGNDIARGGQDNDQVFGDVGNDTIYGDAGNDTLTGGEGNDVFALVAATGTDTIADFVDGQDKMGLDGLTFADLAIAQDGSNVTISSGGTILATVIGGVAANFTADDFVSLGNDTGSGGGGGVGNNILGGELPETIGATSSSTVTGLPANIATSAADTINGAGGNDTISGLDGNDSIVGGIGNDSIAGGGGNDFVDGGADNDIIDGGAGTDTILGGDGNDSLSGLDGNDSINGGAGDNTLVGGAGTDTLTGGAGVSVFAFSAPTEGTDTINDFVAGTDNIRILASAFGVTATPVSITTAANSGGFSLISAATPLAVGSNPNFLFDETTKFLKFDVDGAGSGVAVDLAFLTGVTTLATGDFTFI